MSRALRKLIDIGPAGVIAPGSAQDFRYHDNRAYVRDTDTGWVRFWADWPSLQPDGGYAIDDPAGPGYAKLLALDEQVRLACRDGLRVLLLPYRFPTWVNGTAGLNGKRNTDAEIAFEPWDRMPEARWTRYVRAGRDPAAYNPRRNALEYRLPDDAFGPQSAWARFFEFLYRRYHWGQRSSGRFAEGFELVNEPNLQLWPQQAPAPPGAGRFAPGPLTIPIQVAEVMATAQEIAARYGSTTRLYAPSTSDGDTPSSRRSTRWDEFVPARTGSPRR